MSMGRVMMVGMAGGIACVLGACQQPPAGSTGGRLDPAGTTRAEASDPQVLPSALFEFSDRVSEQLAADLRGIPELQGQRITVVFGDHVNKTGIVPSSDFEAFRTRIRGRLMQSGVVRENVRFVEMRQRVDDLIQRETGKAGREQASREGRYLERKELDPATTYFLNGEMYRVDRGGERVNLYMMSYTLTSMSDGAIVWQNTPYEIKQRAGY